MLKLHPLKWKIDFEPHQKKAIRINIVHPVIDQTVPCVLHTKKVCSEKFQFSFYLPLGVKCEAKKKENQEKKLEMSGALSLG